MNGDGALRLAARHRSTRPQKPRPCISPKANVTLHGARKVMPSPQRIMSRRDDAQRDDRFEGAQVRDCRKTQPAAGKIATDDRPTVRLRPSVGVFRALILAAALRMSPA